MELSKEFCAVVIELGIATAEEVRDARREQRRLARERRRVFVAELLMERGAIDRPGLIRTLDRARGYRESGDELAPRVGEIAIAKGYASPAQVFESLVDQRDEVVSGGSRRLLGDIMIDHCRLTPWELEDVLVTAAELAAGSLRSGETPAEAFAVGPDLYGGSELYARSYRRTIARLAPVSTRPAPTLVRDVMEPAFRTTPDVRVGKALEGAIDEDAQAILVFHHEDLVGVLSTWDARELDPCLSVGCAMVPAPSLLDSLQPVADATAALHAIDLGFVPVSSVGGIEGVVSRESLRRSGLRVGDEALVELGGSD
jgi:CBS domain-containing protein